MNADGIQRVHVKRGARIVHVETPLGVINIHIGLRDQQGRRVETISISGNNYSGDPLVVRRGYRLVELKTVRGGQ